MRQAHPVSSSTSRNAACRQPSPASMCPFGKVQTISPWRFFTRIRSSLPSLTTKPPEETSLSMAVILPQPKGPDLLQSGGRAQEGRLVKSGGDELKADGQAGAGQAAGQRDAGVARHVRRNGEHVGKVHGHGVRSLFAQAESRGRTGRSGDDVD